MDAATSLNWFDGEERVAIRVRVLDLGIERGDWGSRCRGRHCRCWR